MTSATMKKLAAMPVPRATKKVRLCLSANVRQPSRKSNGRERWEKRASERTSSS